MSENTERRPAARQRRRGPMGHGPMGAPVEKAKDFKGTLKQLLTYLAAYKIAIITVMILAVGSTVFLIFGPNIMGNATTEVFNGLMRKVTGKGGIDFGRISNYLILTLCLYVVSAIFSYIQGFLMTGVTQKVTYDLRKKMSEKIARMPMSFFDRQTHGEILTHFTNDIDTLSQSLNQSLTQVITAVFTIVGVFIMMVRINWQMTLIALIILPVSGMIIGLVIRKSQKYFRQQQEHLGHVNGQVEEVFGGHSIVKAFNGEERAVEEFGGENKKLYGSAWRSQFLSGMMFPIMTFVGNIGYVAVAIVGGYMTIKGRIQVGDIQKFVQYTRQFTQPIGQLAQVSNMLQSTVAAAERVFEFLAEPEEEQTVEAPVSTANLAGNVTFKNVRFGYDPEKIIINDFSTEVKDSQKVAIVGPTGAGKTTMVKLLMRFYDLNGGEIDVDGINIRRFNRSDLRGMFGMVLQDAWMFSGTIMENIRYGRLDATDEEVIAAAKAAYAHHFIKTLPGGYNMELNEESTNISQGQKQLLTIARAILADPKILILDEATSSVDTRTEILIQNAMDKLMQGRTSFVIAHRLSTIKNADLILVMNHGDIVEQGTHGELLAKNGFYAELYNSQFAEAESA